MAEQAKFVDNGPMLNAYPDSMGGRLGDISALLARPALAGVFQSFYILPVSLIRIWTAAFRSWTTA